MKFLIIDDETLICRSLARIIEKSGHEIKVCTNPKEGLDLWRAWDPDLVFLDVVMPELSGVEILQKIGIPRRAKVILMSAYSGEHNISKIDAKGADRFVTKPFADAFLLVKEAQEMVIGRK